MSAAARPRRSSAAATAAKIDASLKEQAKAGKKRKEEFQEEAATKDPPRKKSKPATSKPTAAAKKATSKPTAAAKKAAHAPEVVLLGHVISRCVGIQHYHGNGMRYNKEPLQLKRQPNNRYDPNAIGVYTVNGKQVGHVEAKTGDVAAITQ